MKTIFIVLLIVFLIKTIFDHVKKSSNSNNSDNKIPTLKGEYNCKEGNFKYIGDKDNFVVSKDNRFEFLVKDGVIVACKDKKRHSDFVYYKGEENV
ncbi:hypothetical protein [Clostridium sp. 'White wine YQ']|uniref:hypothetical protein n=1 Tax=Clostridium sp. 'White wine YQ' TaxID=3027474 RepID=UPI0023666EBE|nr:hypothetical protein [Clostridium sp. 'White wine YQ']MDD7794367.1 hypothetical protein [Clostridium sp. 'White wine YQ']